MTLNPGVKKSSLFLWGGLSLVTGLPFLTAGITALLLSGKLVRGLAATALLLFGVWYLAGFHDAGVAAVTAAAITFSVRAGFSLRKVVYITSGAALLSGSLLSLGFTGFMSMSLAELEPLRDFYLSAGMDQATIDQVFSLIVRFSPGIGAVQLVTGAIAATFLFRAAAYSRNLCPGLQGNFRFRMNWAIAWIPIVCLLTVVLARSHNVPDIIQRISGNLLLFMALPYFIEGFQVTLQWARRIPGMIFLLIISGFFATPIVISGVLLLGILDTWFDYRKKLENRIERINNEGSSDKDR